MYNGAVVVAYKGLVSSVIKVVGILLLAVWTFITAVLTWCMGTRRRIDRPALVDANRLDLNDQSKSTKSFLGIHKAIHLFLGGAEKKMRPGPVSYSDLSIGVERGAAQPPNGLVLATLLALCPGPTWPGPSQERRVSDEYYERVGITPRVSRPEPTTPITLLPSCRRANLIRLVSRETPFSP